jgi:hypothetical protein
MKIFMIWARDALHPDDEIWLVDSWDEDTAIENDAGYREALDKHRADHGADNVSITVSVVDFEAVRASFGPTPVPLTPA